MMHLASRALSGARKQWQRLGLDDRGSAIAFLAVLPVLAGAAAIGIETGQLYRVKRQMQSSADAAALAGAIDRMAGKNLTIITATAKYEAQRNGFFDGASNVVVTVNAPPSAGANVSTTGAVEVIITKTMGFSLGAVLVNWLGGTPATFDMRARSVAAQGSIASTTTSYEGCMVALTTTAGDQGVSITNFNNFNSDCTVMSNSPSAGTGSSTTNTSTNASIYLSNFNSATLKSAWSRGSIATSSYNSITYSNAAQTLQTSFAVDPYANSWPTAPTLGSCTSQDWGTGSNADVYPGTYCSGLTITGKSNVYLRAGTYFVADGNLTISSDNNVSCSDCGPQADGTVKGVTFVLTQTSSSLSDVAIGGVTITSENNITLNAPSTGTYAGVLFYQDRRATVGAMNSATKIFTVSSLNNATLTGAIYFPNNRIAISSVNNFGGSASTGCTIWIGRYIQFQSFNNNYKGGCATYNTTPVGITTNTTVTKGKVVE